MVPWIERPVLEMDEARPLADASFPPEAIESARRLLGAISASIPPKARMLAYLARVRTWNRFHAEMSAMADRAGVNWRDLMLANLSYDLLLASLGCSTIALPTADGPLLARNMDWFPEDLLARASYLVRVCRNGELRFASAGWPGGVGVVTGLSARGFAVALNAVLCPEPICKTGYPVLLHLRCVVEDARDFDQALVMLRDQRLTAAGLFTLVGSDNRQRVVIERTPTRHALRWPENGEALLATNDYRLLFPPKEGNGLEIYRTTCHRFAALERMFARWSPERTIADAQLLYVRPVRSGSDSRDHGAARAYPATAKTDAPFCAAETVDNGLNGLHGRHIASHAANAASFSSARQGPSTVFPKSASARFRSSLERVSATAPCL